MTSWRPTWSWRTTSAARREREFAAGRGAVGARERAMLADLDELRADIKRQQDVRAAAGRGGEGADRGQEARAARRGTVCAGQRLPGAGGGRGRSKGDAIWRSGRGDAIMPDPPRHYFTLTRLSRPFDDHPAPDASRTGGGARWMTRTLSNRSSSETLRGSRRRRGVRAA